MSQHVVVLDQGEGWQCVGELPSRLEADLSGRAGKRDIQDKFGPDVRTSASQAVRLEHFPLSTTSVST